MSIVTTQTQNLQTHTSVEDLCAQLIKSPHYRKMGMEGLLAIAHQAESCGVNIMRALNGGMYFVQGRVEMAAFLMNELIRKAGHSVQIERCDDEICILRGRRKDNGDEMKAQFTVADAQRAGIYRASWLKYPSDMLFARALSRLGRRLFADVLCGCYVEGEIALQTLDREPEIEQCDCVMPDYEIISEEEYDALEELIGENMQLRGDIVSFLKRTKGVETIRYLPKTMYSFAVLRAKQELEKRENQSEAKGA